MSGLKGLLYEQEVGNRRIFRPLNNKLLILKYTRSNDMTIPGPTSLITITYKALAIFHLIAPSGLEVIKSGFSRMASLKGRLKDVVIWYFKHLVLHYDSLYRSDIPVSIFDNI